MRLAIRTGLDEDWEAMRGIFTQAAQAAWGHILSAATLTDLSAPDRWHPLASAHVLVAASAGKVVGFVCLRASADDDAEPTVGEVDGCYVLPSVWGTGVGQALLAAAAEYLAASGFKEATLWTEHRNDRLCASTALPDGGSMVPSAVAPFEIPSCWSSAIGSF